MSKYVIIHGQFHEITDDELMHWKYLKRHKQNGKWVYTYPSDTNKSNKPKVSSEYQAEVAYNSQKNQYPTNSSSSTTSKKTNNTSGKKPTINDSTSGKVKSGKNTLFGNDLKWVEQKEFVDKLNASMKAKGPKYPDSYEKYQEYQNKPKNSLIDKIKDKLGVDERDVFLDAAYNKYRSDQNAEYSKKEADKALKSFERLRDVGAFEGEHALDAESHWDHYQRKNNVAVSDAAYAEMYGKAYTELKEQFLKTPLGKLYEAEEKVDKAISDARKSAEEWLDKLFGKKR